MDRSLGLGSFDTRMTQVGREVGVCQSQKLVAVRSSLEFATLTSVVSLNNERQKQNVHRVKQLKTNLSTVRSSRKKKYRRLHPPLPVEDSVLHAPVLRLRKGIIRREVEKTIRGCVRNDRSTICWIWTNRIGCTVPAPLVTCS